MFVVKRDGSKENVLFDKILQRINKLCKDDLPNINVVEVCKKVINQLCDNVHTSELDIYTANVCGSLITTHPEYDVLASRILMSNNAKSTPDTFSKATQILHENEILDQKYAEFVAQHADVLDHIVNENKTPYTCTFFAYKTLEKSYLLHVNGKTIERPSYMIMRLSVAIHFGSGSGSSSDTLDQIKNNFEMMSAKLFIHATPTLFNAGTKKPQCSSCFLIGIQDSIEDIMNTATETALISKHSGGLGMPVSDIRSSGTLIKGTNGNSTGIVKMLQVFQSLTEYVNQGGKRNGSMCIYLEPWHGDIEDFLELRKNNGIEEHRARKLFYALWMCDLLMKRIKSNEKWSLMCPKKCPGLTECHGDAFEALYTTYEKEGRYNKQVNARELWSKVLAAQIETGMPYILYKDHVNNKSCMKGYGTIKSSNLCAEIVEHSGPGETAVCNLASISLPTALGPELDYGRLQNTVRQIVININKIIDFNFYPVQSAKSSNLYHRPMGIGVQGLADLFMMLKLPYESEEAARLNALIFENIYYAAVDQSSLLAQEQKHKFQSYEYSTYKSGELQFDLWKLPSSQLTLDWEPLRERVKEHGLLNSQLVALMPTASTSQIMGFTESFEPLTSNIYKRKTLAGEFIIMNNHLVKELQAQGLWNKEIIENIILNNGSVSKTPLSEESKQIFKTVWEIKQKSVINMASARGAFVDQSQSMNLYLSKPDPNVLSAMHFYGWEKGLKTGMYYLRSRAGAEPDKISVDPSKIQEACSNGACSA